MSAYDRAGLKAPAYDPILPYRILINTFTFTMRTGRFLDPSLGRSELRAAVRRASDEIGGPGVSAPGPRFCERTQRTMKTHESDVLNGSYWRESKAVVGGAR